MSKNNQDENEKTYKRNYQSESEWQKKKYKRIELRVDKQLGEQFVNLLEKQGISRNQWGSEQIKKYLEKFEKST